MNIIYFVFSFVLIQQIILKNIQIPQILITISHSRMTLSLSILYIGLQMVDVLSHHCKEYIIQLVYPISFRFIKVKRLHIPLYYLHNSFPTTLSEFPIYFIQYLSFINSLKEVFTWKVFDQLKFFIPISILNLKTISQSPFISIDIPFLSPTLLVPSLLSILVTQLLSSHHLRPFAYH